MPDLTIPDGWQVNRIFENTENFVSLETVDTGGHIDIITTPEGVTLQLRIVDADHSTWVVESRVGVSHNNTQEHVDELVAAYHNQYSDQTYTDT